MKIAIVGYRGYLGTLLLAHRKSEQWVPVSRAEVKGSVDQLCHMLEGCDTVINLAGSPILKRWTKRNKRRIEQSRQGINLQLVTAINRLKQKPKQFISASAVGYYSTEGIHDENSNNMAKNYLAEVVKDWEEPLQSLDPEVTRTILRIGVVLGRKSGALSPLLRAARWGTVPIVGSGKQNFPFIHEIDFLKALDLILDGRLGGIFNLCSPHHVDNATFAKTLAKVTGRKLIIRIPALFIRLGLGKAHILLTRGQTVLPTRLSEKGMTFQFPEIDAALQNLVKKH